MSEYHYLVHRSVGHVTNYIYVFNYKFLLSYKVFFFGLKLKISLTTELVLGPLGKLYIGPRMALGYLFFD